MVHSSVPPCENPNYTVVLNTGYWAGEVEWYIENFEQILAESNGYSDFSQYEQQICLDDDCYLFWMIDTYGDGWNGGSFNLYGLDGNQILYGYLSNGNAQELYFDLGGV